MFQHKYGGQFTDAQIDEYFKSLHRLIHWLLRYKENNNDETLTHYFDVVQFKLSGANELLNCPPELLQIMSLVESAKQEYLHDTDTKLFRSAILDAHDILDKLKLKVGDKGE